MNNKLERIWKEVVMLMEVLSRDLPGGTEGNHEKRESAGVPAKIRAKHLAKVNQRVLPLRCSFR
jgi:hypothetical protein